MSVAVRTTTAFMTWPFLTRPRGIASLTETTMVSPTEAYLRCEPPSTLMHMTRRAPELSATSRLDCIWIMALVPSRSKRPRLTADQTLVLYACGTRVQRLFFDIGAVSSIHTTSPTSAALASSWAWYFFERRTVFFITGWVKARSTRTT